MGLCDGWLDNVGISVLRATDGASDGSDEELEDVAGSSGMKVGASLGEGDFKDAACKSRGFFSQSHCSSPSPQTTHPSRTEFFPLEKAITEAFKALRKVQRSTTWVLLSSFCNMRAAP